MTVDVRFDRYHNVEELDAILHELASAHPQRTRLQSIGKTFDGRDMWLLTINDFAAGDDLDKPAYWIDGNMHASEVAGSMAALHAAHRILSGWDSDVQVRRLVERMAFYVLPRVNPDGAKRLFDTPPRDVRSGTRPYPYPELDDGLYEEDIDGDGRILTMRIEDPTGHWKVSNDDSRLMLPREPNDEGGTYYRMFPEGLIRNYDGHIIKNARPVEGLDHNRNFPAGWDVENVQHGAGPFPLSEPETRALADFLSTHRNIVGAVSYHTTGGVFFRPSSFRSDDEMPEHDLNVYKYLGEHTKRITGYKAVATFHEFSKSGRATLHGGFLDWLYQDLGIFVFSPEIWDYPGRAGVQRRDDDGGLQEWYYKHPPEDDLKVLRWLDANYQGRGFVAWHPFDHPQLGSVEIGGWDGQFVLYNPPPDQLESEISKNTEFVLLHAALAPLLQIRALTATMLGGSGDVHRVTLVAENTGFLSTSGSTQARTRGAARPVFAEIEGGDLMSGLPRVELGHLEGRSAKLRRGSSSDTTNRARAEWLVRATRGTEITVRVRSDRGGSVRGSITI